MARKVCKVSEILTVCRLVGRLVSGSRLQNDFQVTNDPGSYQIQMSCQALSLRLASGSRAAVEQTLARPRIDVGREHEHPLALSKR